MLYDVAEEIDVEAVRRWLGIGEADRKPSFERRASEYVRFERPPAVEHLQSSLAVAGAGARGAIQYYDYGVVSVELKLPFSGSWKDLEALAVGWMSSPEIGDCAKKVARGRLVTVKAALANPCDSWIEEDYFIFQVDPIQRDDGSVYLAKALLEERGAETAQIVRGEIIPLSEDEQREVRGGAISHYPDDFIVVDGPPRLCTTRPRMPRPRATSGVRQCPTSSQIVFNAVASRASRQRHKKPDRRLIARELYGFWWNATTR